MNPVRSPSNESNPSTKSEGNLSTKVRTSNGVKRLSLYLCLYLITLWLGGNFFAFPKSQPMIAVTAVKVVPPEQNKKGAKARATVVLNNCIKINEIEIYPVRSLELPRGPFPSRWIRIPVSCETSNGVYPLPEGDIVLRYPGWIDKSGRDHPQIELLTRQAREEVRKAIQTRCPSSFKVQTQKFKIVRIKKPQTASSTKAFCVVNFNKAVNLHCKVLKGKWGLWVGWPGEKENERWIKQVEIIDHHLKKSIKNSVLKKYQELPGGD